MIKWAKSVTKGKMVNNFPTTILIKNQFALKDRLVCLEHLRANQFLINTVFEELFKKLCLSLVYLIMCAADLVKFLSSNGMVCCSKSDQTSRLDMLAHTHTFQKRSFPSSNEFSSLFISHSIVINTYILVYYDIGFQLAAHTLVSNFPLISIITGSD